MARIPRTHNSRTIPVFPNPTLSATGQPLPPDVSNGNQYVLFNANLSSNPIYASELIGQFNCYLDVGTGLTGTFSLQASWVPDAEQTTNADWVTITPTVIGTALVYAGSAGTSVIIAPPNVFPEWWRINLAFTSGSANGRAWSRVDNQH